MRIAIAASAASIALVLGGCGRGSGASALPQGAEHVTIDSASFSATIDNPYWPMAVGTRWTYRETDDEGGKRHVVVTVLPQTKTIMGVETRIVHDQVTDETGAVIENTHDWYAQDADGNIWYFGEATTESEHGKPPSTAGSWEAGVDGAEPGVVVPANPQPGLSYREEYYAGQAEDAAEVLAVDENVEVPYGFFQGALLTRNTTTVESKVEEHKLYVKGVGPVLEIGISGGTDKTVLLSRS